MSDAISRSNEESASADSSEADSELGSPGSDRFAGLGAAIAAAAAEIDPDSGDPVTISGGVRSPLDGVPAPNFGPEPSPPPAPAENSARVGATTAAEGADPDRPDPAGPDPAGPDLDAADLDRDVEEAADRLLDDLDRLQGERNEYLDQLLRTKADFENYRKRVLKQQADQAARSAEELVEKLLEVLDVYDGAKVHAEGFEQVGATLVGLLSKEGLERIDPVGMAFDPNEADAVMHEEGDGGPVVSSVLRPGYRWKGRVVRPAMVQVRG